MDVTATELQKLEGALLGAFKSYKDFERLATIYLGITLNEISHEQPLRDVIKDLFIWADGQGKWVDFLKQATNCAPTNRVLRFVCHAILDRLLAHTAAHLAASVPPQPGLVDAILLANRQPFMDRDDVRARVRSMAMPDGIRVLSVYGSTKSGKSYIHDFLMFLHGAGWLQADCSLSKVGDDFSSDVSAGELAEHIATQFDPAAAAPEKRPTETPQKWADRCAEWLRHQFRLRPQQPCWVVLDGFDDPLISSTTLDLIRGLAKRVLRDLHHVRLVLLGVPATFLRLHQYLSADCEVKILDETQWVTFFLDVARCANLSDHAQVADQWVEEVRLGVPAQAPERFRMVAEYCRHIVVRHLPEC